MNKIGLHKRKRLSPAEELAEHQRVEHLTGLKQGTIIPVDKSKVFSRSVIPDIPDYYRNVWFACKDCGKRELWTAEQQKLWYEEQGGEIEAVAVRCRICRRKEKVRQKIARRVHLDGLERKRAGRAEKGGPANGSQPIRSEGNC